MGFFQAEGSTPWFGACILLGSTGNVADPHGAHELEAWKSAQIVGVPFPELGVLRVLADDGIEDESVAEAVNHCCDGECATEPFVQTRFRHFSPPRRLPEYYAKPLRLGFHGGPLRRTTRESVPLARRVRARTPRRASVRGRPRSASSTCSCRAVRASVR